MTEDATADDGDPPELPAGEDPLDTIERYEADGGLVLYDAENPLAWMKGSNAVDLEERR